MNQAPGLSGARRAALLLILLAGHAGLLLIGPARRTPDRPLPARPAPSWLLPLRQPVPLPEPSPDLPRDIPPAAAPVATSLAGLPAPAAQSAESSAPTVPAALGEGADAGPATPGPLPLRLGLPLQGPSRRSLAPALANQALNDPRSNSPRLSASERFAITLGSLECVLDERQPDGTVRRFEGRLRTRPSNTASLDPFGHSAATGGGFGDTGAVLGGNSIRGSTVAECVK